MSRRNRRNRLSIADMRAVGLDFIELLDESKRRNITDKIQLRTIYNDEFRNRDGVRDPNFSSVLYVLRKSNKALIKDGQVNFKSVVRARPHDQWFRPLHRQEIQASPAQARLSPPPDGQEAPDPPAVPGPDGGVRARRKLAKDILRRLNTEDRSEFIADKYGVRVSSDMQMEDGKIQFCVDRAEVFVIKLFVENTSQEVVYFTYYTALHWLQCFTLEDRMKVTRNNPRCLQPGERYEVIVRFKSDNVGVYSAILAFEFKKDNLAKPFHIVRFIEGVYRLELAAQLGPTEPYRPFRLQPNEQLHFTVDKGFPPEDSTQNNLIFVVLLEQYKPPSYMPLLVNFLKSRNSVRSPSTELLESQSLLESQLNFNDYAKRFDLLLYLEEDQMRMDIKRYNKNDVPMEEDAEDRKLLVLELPGVSENRPSVLRGDHLFLTKSDEINAINGTKYQGYVHRVELDRVKLGFSRRLRDNFIKNMKFRVEFTVNRLPLQLQHRAVKMAVDHNLKDVLFPTSSMNNVCLPKLRLFDIKLEKNLEQYTAVCNIVAGVSKPAPYLVFGPPGTGKTVTIVEAIKQVEKNIPGAFILACAPSNSAADQLCEKLISSQHVDKGKIYRLYASSRNPRDIPGALLDNSNVKGNVIVFPSKEDLMSYKIVVSTLVTAGRLVSGGVPVGHFSHIFVDEAGHAVESETLISVAGLLDAKMGQLVLAGDPKQLGPILRSPFAINYGLGLSFLERLMTQNELYMKGATGYDNHYVTKLLKNYRSHRSILKVPNELFYDGELMACADEISSNQYCAWEHLPKRDFPVIFHGVIGRDDREANSPSFFNTSEIEIIMKYLEKLLLTQAKKGIAKLAPKDIGIIAPYRKQVEKLRMAIKIHRELKTLMGIEELKIGSVEEFQGQERKVIIVSTVRSSRENITFDEKFNIGFLKNEKRFNVAVTRAKALLIIVGNPIILKTDANWGRFIKYCEDEGGYTGHDISSLPDVELAVEGLLALNLQALVLEETEESVIQQHIHPGWRHEH